MKPAASPGEDALRLATRRRIYEHVRANPGCYQRELQRALDLAAGNLDYHLDFLEKRSLVTSQVQDNYKRYYASAQVKAELKPLLALLRQQMPRRIVVWLLEHPRSSHKSVAQGVAMPPSSLAFHLRKLVNAGVVGSERAGRETLFWVRDPDPVIDLLLTYRVSLLDGLVDRFLDTFIEMNPGYMRGKGPGGAPSLPPAPPPEGEAPPPAPEGPAGEPASQGEESGRNPPGEEGRRLPGGP